MTRKVFVSIAAMTLAGGLFANQSFADNAPVAPVSKYAPALPMHPVVESLCGVDGTVVLDPNDHTNGYLHYKGKVQFTAKQELKGVNLWMSGPEYSCTCVDCPKLSSNALGIQPGSNFTADEKRSYQVDCASWQKPTDGEVGRSVIEHFVASRTDPKAGNWLKASCGGRFAFKQKPTIINNPNLPRGLSAH
jgi:hypothetical protein